MPWRKFAKNWSEAITQSWDAHVQTVVKAEKTLVVSVDKPLPIDRPVRLTFPCGTTLASKPVWQRQRIQERESILAAFVLLDSTEQEWTAVKEPRDGITRGSPRLPMRLWVSFPENRRPGTVTSDLSLEGCRLEGDFRENLNEIIELFLDLPDTVDPLRLNARVVWAKERQAGLRFINLHIYDEVRLLRTLGKTATPPSYFLPNLELKAPSFTYTVNRQAEHVELLLSMANWDVRFDIGSAEFSGNQRGAFQRIEVLSSTDALTRLRGNLGICLTEPQTLVHLRLYDDQNCILFEVLGREIGFHRQERLPRQEPFSEVA
jgi:PilZ domain